MRDLSRTCLFVISAAIALTQTAPTMASHRDSLQDTADDTSFSELYLSDFFIRLRGIQTADLFPNGLVPAPPGPVTGRQRISPRTSLPVHPVPDKQPQTITYSTLSGWNLKDFIVMVHPYPEYANMLLLGGSLLCIAAYGRKKLPGK